MKVNNLLILVSITFLVSCAKVGAPSGGPKDELPPVLLQSSPENNSVNIKSNEWIFQFNEQIQVNEADKNIFISPAPKKKPNISIKGKSLKINILDSLRENETYHVQFIDGIKDINEGNLLPNLQISFSSGPYLDSSSITGLVKNQKNLETTPSIIALYPLPISDTFLKEQPYYITATDKEGTFMCNKIRADDYLLLAYEDKNKNRIPDSDELAGFDSIFLRDSIYKVILVTHQNPDSIQLKILSTFKGSTPNQYVIHYSQPINDGSSIELNLLQGEMMHKKQITIPYYIGTSRDSLFVFLTELDSEQDSFLMTIRINNKTDTANFKQITDTLKNSPLSKGSNPTKFASFLILHSEYPILKTNSLNLQLIEDSMRISVDSIILEHPFKLEIHAAFKAFTKYTLITKNSITYTPNLVHHFDDTISFTTTNYEQNFLHILPVDLDSGYDYIFELYQDQKVIQGVSKPDGIWFYGINPGTYSFRAIQDINKNNKHDGVILSKMKASEPIWHSDKIIEIKAEWDYEKQEIRFYR